MKRAEQLNSAKNVAKVLLYTDMEETAYTPIVVLHPFFESAMLVDNKGPFNALEETERYTEYLKHYSIFLEKCTDIAGLLRRVRKSYRLTYLKLLVSRKIITLQECGNLLASVWSSIEIINHDTNVSKSTVLNWIKHADKHVLMDVNEYKVYEALPNVITIYRGCKNITDAHGISWTLSQETAKWFAERFSRNNKVYTAQIEKKHVIGYLADRGEQEVLVDYRYLQNIEIL